MALTYVAWGQRQRALLHDDLARSEVAQRKQAPPHRRRFARLQQCRGDSCAAVADAYAGLPQQRILVSLPLVRHLSKIISIKFR
jgi:hypothetical protein